MAKRRTKNIPHTAHDQYMFLALILREYMSCSLAGSFTKNL
jgi:hypothetical protein